MIFRGLAGFCLIILIQRPLIIDSIRKEIRKYAQKWFHHRWLSNRFKWLKNKCPIKKNFYGHNKNSAKYFSNVCELKYAARKYFCSENELVAAKTKNILNIYYKLTACEQLKMEFKKLSLRNLLIKKNSFQNSPFN